jgi:acetyltransferase-like isoleucine patch superfamily enzyme
MLHRVFLELVESSIRHIGGPVGRKIRIWYYDKRLKSCGENCVIEEGVYITNPHLITLGNNVWIDKNTMLIAGAFDKNSRQYKEKGNRQIPWGELHIGKGCHIAPFSLIQAHGGVQIGENVTIAAGAKIYSLSHHYRNLNDTSDTRRYSFSSKAPLDKQFMIVGNVYIGENAAVGINAVILPGTTIPKGTWIGILSSPTPKDILKENSVFKN